MTFANHNGVDIHYEREGRGPTLTICGGLGDSYRNWQLLIQKLKDDFDVVYVQNRGAGQSAKPTQPYNMVDMAGDVSSVLRQEGIAKTHMLGFSMGGRIAMQWALQNPESLQKLVLVSTAPAWHRPHPPSDDVLMHLADFDGSDESFAKTYEILYSPEFRKSMTAKAFVKFRKADPFLQSLQDYQLQLNALLHFDIVDQLPNITAPTLIFAGDQDALTPFANALFLHAQLKNSQIKIYESTGHLVQYEQQKSFLEDITTFLKS